MSNLCAEILLAVKPLEHLYDENGEIDYNNSIVRKINDNIIKPYMNESGNASLSSNNIKEYNYYYNKILHDKLMNNYLRFHLLRFY